jgi:hypothetical protein
LATHERSIPALSVQLVGGLGSQLSGLAAGWALAGHFNSPLILDGSLIPYGSNAKRRFELAQFVEGLDTLFELTSIQTRPNRARLLAEGLRRKVNLNSTSFVPSDESNYRDSGESVTAQLKKIQCGATIGGYFYDFGWADFALSYNFPNRLSPSFPSPSYLKVLQKISPGDVGIHIRLGDFENLRHIYPNIPEKYYLEALKNTRSNQKSRVFLFSDNLKLAQQKFPRLARKIDHVVTNYSGQSSLETMALLSQCDSIIASNSSFSSWAGWFASNRGATIFTPVPHHLQDWSDHLPNSWQRFSLESDTFIS